MHSVKRECISSFYIPIVCFFNSIQSKLMSIVYRDVNHETRCVFSPESMLCIVVLRLLLFPVEENNRHNSYYLTLNVFNIASTFLKVSENI